MMLRRTSKELDRGLPPKKLFLLVCRPTGLQRSIHSALAQPSAGRALARLSMMRSNLIHPELLLTSAGGVQVVRELAPKLPEQPSAKLACSGKLQAAARLLDYILEKTTERAVVVSSSVRALSLVSEYVRAKMESDAATCYLVGSTPKRTREKNKKLFNGTGEAELRVMLLVDKLAEGQTLIGANHLILLDPTWNPALDQQSLGRIHRPGQRKPCWLYRLLTTGSVEETIIERQAGKLELLQLLSSKTLPNPLLEDHELLFSLDEASIPSRLASHLEELPELIYASPAWSRVDLTCDGGAAALQAFPMVHDLAQHALEEPDVGAQRLAWVAPIYNPVARPQPHHEGENTDVLLSYVFHD